MRGAAHGAVVAEVAFGVGEGWEGEGACAEEGEEGYCEVHGGHNLLLILRCVDVERRMVVILDKR